MTKIHFLILWLDDHKILQWLKSTAVLWELLLQACKFLRRPGRGEGGYNLYLGYFGWCGVAGSEKMTSTYEKYKWIISQAIYLVLIRLVSEQKAKVRKVLIINVILFSNLFTLLIPHVPIKLCSFTMVSYPSTKYSRYCWMGFMTPRAVSTCCESPMTWGGQWWKWSGPRSLRTGRYFNYTNFVILTRVHPASLTTSLG